MTTQLRPTATNLMVITGFLTNQNGSLGRWLLPTNINAHLEGTLAAASHTLTNASDTLQTADREMQEVAAGLKETLDHLAGITASFRTQVETNDALIGRISEAVLHADELMQGLKTHWLLRSAFDKDQDQESSTNRPPNTPFLDRRKF